MSVTDLIPELLTRDVDDVADALLGRVSAELWSKLPLEQRQDVIAFGLRAVGARMEERAIQELTTDAEFVDLDDQIYKRLGQASSSEYFGMPPLSG